MNWTPNHEDPEVFHITRVENLASIAQHGLLSDSQVNLAQGSPVVIGNPSIKQRRLTWQLNLPDRPLVGDFVPFYFCPRSVMLYLVARGTAGGQAGQNGMVHLVSRVSRLANLGQRCVFTDANAAASYHAMRILAPLVHPPLVRIERSWYYP